MKTKAIMISKEDLSRGDVVDAYVFYEDEPSKGKVRPVLVISPEEVFALALKMTSHPPRQNFPGEYQIIRWAQAGLPKPTTVRISKLLKIQYENIIKVRGRLAETDMLQIMYEFNRIYG